jgi:hypothetical protein
MICRRQRTSHCRSHKSNGGGSSSTCLNIFHIEKKSFSTLMDAALPPETPLEKGGNISEMKDRITSLKQEPTFALC